MKKLSVIVFAFMTTVMLASAAMAAQPKVLAVQFYADWCASCKALAPAYEELQSKAADKDVLFVKFDLTDETTKHQTAMRAHALGLSKIYADYPKTGFILLLNAETKDVLGKLTKADGFAQMHKGLTDALAGKKVKPDPAKAAHKGSDMEHKGSHKGSGMEHKGSY